MSSSSSREPDLERKENEIEAINKKNDLSNNDCNVFHI
jgi:hypothetical protein